MAHPYAGIREVNPGRKAAGKRTGFKAGGNVGTAVPKMPGRKSGGGVKDMKVVGRASGGRLDKFARGGKTKGKHGNHVNIAIVAPHGAPPGAMGAAPAAPGALPPPGGGLPPGLPPKPPMAMPPGGPPGVPPGMPKPPGMMKKGGRVKMTAGADTGEGRLQKKRAYKARG